jgi:hypothetical protein
MFGSNRALGACRFAVYAHFAASFALACHVQCGSIGSTDEPIGNGNGSSRTVQALDGRIRGSTIGVGSSVDR